MHEFGLFVMLGVRMRLVMKRAFYEEDIKNLKPKTISESVSFSEFKNIQG